MRSNRTRLPPTSLASIPGAERSTITGASALQWFIFYRNVFSHAPALSEAEGPAGKLREIARMLKAMHVQEDLAAAQRKAGEVLLGSTA